MTFWQKNRFQHFTWMFRDTGHSVRDPVRWGFMRQWGTAGLVGLLLGIYSVAVWSLPSKWVLLSIPVILAPFVAMVFGQIRKLLLAIIIIDIPLQMDIYLSYRDDAAAFGAVGGWIVSLSFMALLGLYILWLAELLAKKNEALPKHSLWTHLPLILYLGFCIFSLIAARDVQLSLFKVFLFAQVFLIYVYIIYTIRTRQDVLFIITLLLIGLILESLIMIALKGIGHSIDTGIMVLRIDSGERVGGTVGGPNPGAGYLGLLLAPAMSMLLTPVSRLYKTMALIAFSLGGLALFFTLSRGGWVAFTLSIVLLYFFAWCRGWLPLALPVVSVIFVLIMAYVFQDALLARVFGSDNGSAESRIPLMMIAQRMIMDNLVFGVGLNNYAVAMWKYANLEMTGFWMYVVHNKYLLVWAEAGTGSILAFLWFLLSAIRRGWQCWMFNDRFLSPLAFSFATAILGHMVHMNFDTFQFRALIQMLWVSVALIVVMHRIGIEEQLPMSKTRVVAIQPQSNKEVI